jgi:hypothetical protein
MVTHPVGSPGQDDQFPADDFRAHVQTYRSFLRGIQMAVGAAILVLILMAVFLI